MIYTAPLSLSLTSPLSAPLSAPLNKRRYARHLALPDVGEAGQRALLKAHVALIGLGGLGALIAPYLVASGVGRLTLIDFDEVSLSNLQRQPLYSTADLGRPKVAVAAERLDALNPEVAVRPLARPLEELAPRWVEEVGEVDLFVDATDRFSARLLISQLSAHLKRPHLYGSVNGMEGQVALFLPGGPCYRCLFPSLPPPGLIQSCSQAGVLGPAPALIGSAQALLALQHLMGHETPPQLTQLDLATLKSYHLPLNRDERCPQCSPDPLILNEGLSASRVTPLSASSLHARLTEGWSPLILDVRRSDELASGVVEGALHLPVERLEALSAQLTGGEIKAREAPPSSPLSPSEARDVVVYCAQGPRAERAAQTLSTLSTLSPHTLEALSRHLHPHPLSAHLKGAPPLKVWELVGGWRAWAELNAP